MKALHVDLRARRGPSRWIWGGAVVLAMAAVGIAFAAAILYRERRATDAEVSNLRRSQQQEPVRVPPVAAYAGSAHELISEASSSWPSMLTALETVSMIGVTPTSVDIDPVGKQVLVEVEFADYAVLLKYVDELNAGTDGAVWALVRAQSDVGATQGGRRASALLRASLRH